METEQNNKLMAALVAAQAEMPIAQFDSENPHFKSNYASLAAVITTARPVLAKHKIGFTQSLVLEGENHTLRTVIFHESGETMASETPLLQMTKSMQALGSAMTYAKRYALCAMLGIATDEQEDDGEAATDDLGEIANWEEWVVPFGQTTKGKSLWVIANENPEVLPKMLDFMEQRNFSASVLDMVRSAIASVGEEEHPSNMEPADEDEEIPM